MAAGLIRIEKSTREWEGVWGGLKGCLGGSGGGGLRRVRALSLWRGYGSSVFVPETSEGTEAVRRLRLFLGILSQMESCAYVCWSVFALLCFPRGRVWPTQPTPVIC